MKNHLVAYLDVLGCRGAIQANDTLMAFEIEKLIDVCNGLMERRLTQDIYKDHQYFIKTFAFSDNIVLSIQVERDEMFKWVFHDLIIQLRCVQGLSISELGLPLRGAVTYGDLKVTEGKNFIFGKALIDAYEAERDLAIYPRIYVKPEVLDEETMKFSSNLIARDFDGAFFVDYLEQNGISSTLEQIDIDWRVGEVKRHKEFIENCIETYGRNHRILAKYLWMKEYHNRVCRSSKEYMDFLIGPTK